jgi:hypothetical protein
MHLAPTSSEGLAGVYPQIPPQTAELEDQGAMFKQQRRIDRSAHCGCSRAGRVKVVVMRVVVMGTVEKTGEVVMTVVRGVGATLSSVVVDVSVAVKRVSVAVVSVTDGVAVAILLHAAEIFSGAQLATTEGVASSRLRRAFGAARVVVTVRVATTTVVRPLETAVLVIVTRAGVEVEVSVVVV